MPDDNPLSNGVLQKKAGPLKVWQYGALGVAVGAVFIFLRSRKATSSSNATAAAQPVASGAYPYGATSYDSFSLQASLDAILKAIIGNSNNIGCPIGQHWDTTLNTCVADASGSGCPSGQHLVNGICLPDTVTPPPVTCLSGYHKEAGKCVADSTPVTPCPTGQHYDSNLGHCIADSGGQNQGCASGFHKDPSGNCVPDSTFQTCPPGSTFKNGVCVADGGGPGNPPPPNPTKTCPKGFVWSDAAGICVGTSRPPPDVPQLPTENYTIPVPALVSPTRQYTLKPSFLDGLISFIQTHPNQPNATYVIHPTPTQNLGFVIGSFLPFIPASWTAYINSRLGVSV